MNTATATANRLSFIRSIPGMEECAISIKFEIECAECGISHEIELDYIPEDFQSIQLPMGWKSATDLNPEKNLYCSDECYFIES